MNNKLNNVAQQHVHVMFRDNVAGNIERPFERYLKHYTSLKQNSIVSKQDSSETNLTLLNIDLNN